MGADFYDTVDAMEPLLPSTHMQPLLDRGMALTLAAAELKGALHPSIAKSLARLLRSMNSYYSNKIEGHSTHPLNIERGLKHDFSAKPGVAKLQRLALAHIAAEEEIEAWA
jgi:hypothetical protein